MRAIFIHFLCICTFVHGPPLLKAQSTTLEEGDTCSSLQTVLMREEILLLKEQFATSLLVQKKMLKNIDNLSPQNIMLREEILLLKEQFAAMSHQLNGSLVVQRGLRKLVASHHILHIDPLACFDKPARIDIPYCRVGWLVIQRRMDGSVDFYRGWRDYSQGFGDSSGEFWIGLERMQSLTQSRTYKLRIDIEDFDGNTRYAEYSTFAISDEAHGYTLATGTYIETAGDALTRHNHHPILTKDHRGTGASARCPVAHKGAWWYNSCHDSNLNGQYIRGNHTSYADGVNWRQWKGYQYSLKTTIMMIKPVG